MEEIIIQGKPYSGSKVATTGLNPTLVDRIFKIFFDTMGGIRIEKALIVDTMYWDSQWYTVYTYSRYANITDKSDEDKAGRQSYFALSLIIPQAYLYLTSEVYKLLDKVYAETIEGVYISKTGKYLVQDFTNQGNFIKVVEKIKSEFAGSNLQDPIDGSFRKEHSTLNVRYNVLDCDSKAFIDDLKLNGRIIVGTGAEFPQKCAASIIMEKDSQIRQLSAKLAEQEGQIKTLNTNLTNAQQAANNSVSSVKTQLNQLERNVKTLEEKNEQVKQQLLDKQNEFNDLVGKIRALLPDTKQNQVQDDNPTDAGVGVKKYFQFLPLANFILIAVCICLLLLGHSTPLSPDDTVKKLQDQVTQLKEDNKSKDRELRKLQANNDQLTKTITHLQEQINPNNQREAPPPVTSPTKDVDCHVTISSTPDFKDVPRIGTIKNGTIVQITWTPQEGYNWVCWNVSKETMDALAQATNGKAVVPLNWVQSDPNKKDLRMFLSYRSKDKNFVNDCNKIILKVQQ